MYKETTEALKRITIAKATQGMTYGKAISDLYFPKEEAALLCDHKGQSFSILIKEFGIEQNQELLLISKIVEIISYLQRLENENLIYIIQEKTSEVELLYHQADIDRKGSLVGQYMLTDGTRLRIDRGRYLIEKGDIVLLSSQREESSLYEELTHFLYSRIYPTSGLNEYIAGGFKNEDQRQAAEANRLSRNSIRLAWFAAIVSPFASLLLGNYFGITTIEKKQFEKIISSVSAGEKVKEDSAMFSAICLPENTIAQTAAKDTITEVKEQRTSDGK
ncbi:MAG: hypothetical protein J6T94_03830 [Bacteroidaceae bacterium]|nr:hypothetical protein [Bacteroidaceae bacterium]